MVKSRRNNRFRNRKNLRSKYRKKTHIGGLPTNTNHYDSGATELSYGKNQFFSISKKALFDIKLEEDASVMTNTDNSLMFTLCMVGRDKKSPKKFDINLKVEYIKSTRSYHIFYSQSSDSVQPQSQTLLCSYKLNGVVDVLTLSRKTDLESNIEQVGTLNLLNIKDTNDTSHKKIYNFNITDTPTRIFLKNISIKMIHILNQKLKTNADTKLSPEERAAAKALADDELALANQNNRHTLALAAYNAEQQATTVHNQSFMHYIGAVPSVNYTRTESPLHNPFESKLHQQ